MKFKRIPFRNSADGERKPIETYYQEIAADSTSPEWQECGIMMVRLLEYLHAHDPELEIWAGVSHANLFLAHDLARHGPAGAWAWDGIYTVTHLVRDQDGELRIAETKTPDVVVAGELIRTAIRLALEASAGGAIADSR